MSHMNPRDHCKPTTCGVAVHNTDFLVGVQPLKYITKLLNIARENPIFFMFQYVSHVVLYVYVTHVVNGYI